MLFRPRNALRQSLNCQPVSVPSTIEHLSQHEFPKKSQEKVLKLNQQLEHAYSQFAENPNSMFNEKEEEKAMVFGIIRIAIKQYNEIKDDEMSASILNKMDKYFMTFPKLVHILVANRAKKSNLN